MSQPAWARPITGILLATAGTAVHEISQNCQCVRDDLVRAATFDIHHEADTTSIVLMDRVVEALLRLIMLFQIRSPISFIAGDSIRHPYCRTEQLCVF